MTYKSTKTGIRKEDNNGKEEEKTESQKEYKDRWIKPLVNKPLTGKDVFKNEES